MTKGFLVITVLNFIIFFNSCTTTYTDAGYSTELNHEIYEVNCNVNDRTDKYIAVKYIYLKSAETALENGCDYFYILNTLNGDYNESLINSGSNVFTDKYKDLLIGNNSTEYITYVVPEHYLNSDSASLSFIIIPVNNKIEGASEPFNAKLIIADCKPEADHIRRKQVLTSLGIIGGIAATPAIVFGMFILVFL